MAGPLAAWVSSAASTGAARFASAPSCGASQPDPGCLASTATVAVGALGALACSVSPALASSVASVRSAPASRARSAARRELAKDSSARSSDRGWHRSSSAACSPPTRRVRGSWREEEVDRPVPGGLPVASKERRLEEHSIAGDRLGKADANPSSMARGHAGINIWPWPQRDGNRTSACSSGRFFVRRAALSKPGRGPTPFAHGQNFPCFPLPSASTAAPTSGILFGQDPGPAGPRRRPVAARIRAARPARATPRSLSQLSLLSFLVDKNRLSALEGALDS